MLARLSNSPEVTSPVVQQSWYLNLSVRPRACVRDHSCIESSRQKQVLQVWLIGQGCARDSEDWCAKGTPAGRSAFQGDGAPVASSSEDTAWKRRLRREDWESTAGMSL